MADSAGPFDSGAMRGFRMRRPTGAHARATARPASSEVRTASGRAPRDGPREPVPGAARAGRAARTWLGRLPWVLAVVGVVQCVPGGEWDAVRPQRVDRPAGVHTTARPVIVPRERWAGHTRTPPARYADRVVAVFVHHTDSPNDYDCADTPKIIRDLYTGQTRGRHWDDIGYNFLVDRCGTIYEGRAGGVDRAVVGAHTQGFNRRTAGIAAIGTFTAGAPVPEALTDAIAALAAWKLGLSDIDPRGSSRLVSSNGLSRYAAGTPALLPAIAGHYAGVRTSCPGAALKERLPALREEAARLQGRRTGPVPHVTGSPQPSHRSLRAPLPTV